MAPSIHMAAVYCCDSPEQANELLGGQQPGYVYSRDGHPNADLLAEKLRELHGAECGAVAATGMGALALAVLALLESGDHVVVSNQLYGRSVLLLTRELARLGIASTTVDTCDPAATAAAFRENTRLVVAETITNPCLHVSDIRQLGELAHARGARLLIDNTFAGPCVCRPLELHADLVWESLTKSINGHSDVNLGFLAGPAVCWSRVPDVLKTWGLASSPFDCWLALRGLGTLAVRMDRACANALLAARHLKDRADVRAVHYPGLEDHPQHVLAQPQFGGRFGSIVTFTLPGGTAAATRFVTAARRIPFSPSLGDLSTTLSHPESTSHRGLTPQERQVLGIDGGTIRLSVGIESSAAILSAIDEGLAGVGP